jgi:hypothetical protein
LGFLAAEAEAAIKPSTLARLLPAIKASTLKQGGDPTQSELVRSLKRAFGGPRAARRKAPITRERLDQIIEQIEAETSQPGRAWRTRA